MGLKDDLISRSDVAEFMFKNRMCTSINNAYDKLRCIKTAYNVEKVVEQIYKEQEKEFVNNEVRFGEINCSKAVEIVKGGGVEEIAEQLKEGGTDD